MIVRTRAGDREAYDNLVRRYQEIAFRTAYVITGSARDAEEAAQDAFVKAYFALGRFRDGSSFRPWLMTIVANEARNKRNSSIRRFALSIDREDAAEVANDESPEHMAIDAERAEALVACLNGLAPIDRNVVMYRYLLDLTERETASALAVRPGTVKSRLSRALARLRACLTGKLDDRA